MVPVHTGKESSGSSMIATSRSLGSHCGDRGRSSGHGGHSGRGGLLLRSGDLAKPSATLILGANELVASAVPGLNTHDMGEN